MYVKSLTLRGFKSFASATSMRLEPGITCIVGPNGSGKSNVVDALAWVMGEQGAKSLRGGKMEDVIFAGTSGRAPLGRAEVALTIDNTDGALPIDYTEVTIARTMFRNGGSEYAINGTSCRLLDVQELLSDSGIGREMHVIVGQGQLDAVLRATPEERRGFIEEAAGVLKHRKRKEQALRKLESMEANLTRVNDLTGEIRRQLGPLGRQAEAARKAAVIQADARDARLRLLADDLVQLTSTLEQEVADETALIARRTEVEEAWPASAPGSPCSSRRPQEAAPRARPRQDAGSPCPHSERLTSTGRWPPSGCACSPRTTPEAPPPGATPRSCVAGGGAAPPGPGAARRDRRGRGARSRPRRPRAEPRARHAASSSGSPAWCGPPPTGAKAWPGWPARSAPGAPGSRRPRPRSAGCARPRADRCARRRAPQREFAASRPSIAVEEEGEEGLDTAHEQRRRRTRAGRGRGRALREAERAADSDRSSPTARVEALELGLSRRTAPPRCWPRPTATGLPARWPRCCRWTPATRPRSRRPSAGPPTPSPSRPWTRRRAVALLRDGRRRPGRAPRRRHGACRSTRRLARPADGARWARDVGHAAPTGLRPAVDQLLDRVALVDGPAARAAADRARRGVTAVTRDGDIFAPGSVHGGSAPRPA